MLASKWATKPEEAIGTPPKAAPAPTATAETPAAPTETAPAAYVPDVTYEPAYDDPSIDPFAQTASTDDLFFDDDITPIAEPVVEPSPVELQASAAEFVPEEAHLPKAPQAHLTPHAPREARGTERGNRGRGRGRGSGRGRGGNTTDIREQGDKKVESAASKEAESSPAPADATSTETADTPATPAAPAEPKEKPTHSVRGDRTLTGGAARTRLTEEELNAKLANMRSKNEALQTAHARAEADLAKFEAREAVMKKQDVERKKVLAEKQKAERQNRQQMMGEREKNRLRKLNAQGGREWDFEKEEGFSGTGEERKRGATRGAHGGVAPLRPADSLVSEQTMEASTSQVSRGRGRGRGGRSARGGRGDFQGARPTEHKQQDSQNAPSAADFPELPASASSISKTTDTPRSLEFPIKGKTADIKKSELDRPGVKKQESFGLPSPLEKGRSWADEVGS